MVTLSWQHNTIVTSVNIHTALQENTLITFEIQTRLPDFILGMNHFRILIAWPVRSVVTFHCNDGIFITTTIRQTDKQCWQAVKRFSTFRFLYLRQVRLLITITLYMTARRRRNASIYKYIYIYIYILLSPKIYEHMAHMILWRTYL